MCFSRPSVLLFSMGGGQQRAGQVTGLTCGLLPHRSPLYQLRLEVTETSMLSLCAFSLHLGIGCWWWGGGGGVAQIVAQGTVAQTASAIFIHNGSKIEYPMM